MYSVLLSEYIETGAFQEFYEWADHKNESSVDVHITMNGAGIYYEGLAHFSRQQSFVVHAVLPDRMKSYGEDRISKKD